MPRINKYTLDTNLQDGDTLLCTDVNDSNKSKVITLENLRDFIIPPGGLAGQVLKSDGNGGVYWD